jgi:hypothetical protein
MGDFKTEYIEIQFAWTKGESYSDLYHLIATWVKKWKEEAQLQSKLKEEIEDILKRMDFESIQGIVEDFIFGERYLKLRTAVLAAKI